MAASRFTPGSGGSGQIDGLVHRRFGSSTAWFINGVSGGCGIEIARRTLPGLAARYRAKMLGSRWPQSPSKPRARRVRARSSMVKGEELWQPARAVDTNPTTGDSGISQPGGTF
jgi:hypothetical protein